MRGLLSFEECQPSQSRVVLNSLPIGSITVVLNVGVNRQSIMVTNISEHFSASDVEQALQIPDEAVYGSHWPEVQEAVISGDLEHVRKLHDNGADLRSQDEASGVSALMLAAQQVHSHSVLCCHTRTCSASKVHEQSISCQ